MRKRTLIFNTAVIIAATIFSIGCSNPEGELARATAAENTGNFREAATQYAEIALAVTPHRKLPEAHKGSVLHPAQWREEMEKYISWLIDIEPQKNDILRRTLDGLDRSVEHIEQDNTATSPAVTPLDSMPAFSAQWDKAFNPPPPGAVDWYGLTKQAFEKNFSILRLAAPISYTYDINIISRKTGKRITFTLYPESELYIPLAPAEYAVILKSTVEFPQKKRWYSELSAFNIDVSNNPSLIKINLRTRAVQK